MCVCKILLLHMIYWDFLWVKCNIYGINLIHVCVLKFNRTSQKNIGINEYLSWIKVVLLSQYSFRNSLRFLCMKWSVELLDMIIWLRLKLWPTLFQCSFHLNYPHEVPQKKHVFKKSPWELHADNWDGRNIGKM